MILHQFFPTLEFFLIRQQSDFHLRSSSFSFWQLEGKEAGYEVEIAESCPIRRPSWTTQTAQRPWDAVRGEVKLGKNNIGKYLGQ